MTCFMNFFTFIFKVVTLPLKLMEVVGIYGIYKRFFPFLIYKISFTYNKKMNDKKKDLFSNLSEFTKGNGPLRILEIGCGSGANFEFYPSGCKVVCTDPNPHFEKYLQKSLAVNDHLTFERFVVASGEDMGAVKDDSVDVVVSTLVLCSVNNIPRTLQEAHRILRPHKPALRPQYKEMNEGEQPTFQLQLSGAWCCCSQGAFTQLGPGFSCCATLMSFLPEMCNHPPCMYFFGENQDFCTEKAMGITCPAPKHRTEICYFQVSPKMLDRV
nr:methyltransferase-like protein 7A isoform X1 [Oncorhynchus nerka]